MQGYCPECNEPLTLTSILGGRDKRTVFCPECGWSDIDPAIDLEDDLDITELLSSSDPSLVDIAEKAIKLGLVKDPRERRRATEEDQAECRNLGCGPDAWNEECPLHGLEKQRKRRPR